MSTAERDLNGNGWLSGLMLERGVACHARNLVVRRRLLLEPLLDPRVNEALRGVAVVGAGGSRAIGGSAEVRERLERNDTLRKKRPSFVSVSFLSRACLGKLILGAFQMALKNGGVSRTFAARFVLFASLPVKSSVQSWLAGKGSDAIR
jgi:hypothetical protein